MWEKCAYFTFLLASPNLPSVVTSDTQDGPRKAAKIKGKTVLALKDTNNLYWKTTFKWNMWTTSINCVLGYSKCCPNTQVTIGFRDWLDTVKVAIVNKLPYLVILGRYFPGFRKLLVEATGNIAVGTNGAHALKQKSHYVSSFLLKNTFSWCWYMQKDQKWKKEIKRIKQTPTPCKNGT